MNYYKELWKRIGGRPWTYIIRDCWHKSEFFWIVGLVGLGIWLGHIVDGKTILTLWIVFSLGYLAGHVFWGTTYIENQDGDDC